MVGLTHQLRVGVFRQENLRNFHVQEMTAPLAPELDDGGSVQEYLIDPPLRVEAGDCLGLFASRPTHRGYRHPGFPMTPYYWGHRSPEAGHPIQLSFDGEGNGSQILFGFEVSEEVVMNPIIEMAGGVPATPPRMTRTSEVSVSAPIPSTDEEEEEVVVDTTERRWLGYNWNDLTTLQSFVDNCTMERTVWNFGVVACQAPLPQAVSSEI